MRTNLFILLLLMNCALLAQNDPDVDLGFYYEQGYGDEHSEEGKDLCFHDDHRVLVGWQEDASGNKLGKIWGVKENNELDFQFSKNSLLGSDRVITGVVSALGTIYCISVESSNYTGVVQGSDALNSTPNKGNYSPGYRIAKDGNSLIKNTKYLEVESAESNEELDIFPNPAFNSLKIKSNEVLERIIIADLRGKPVITQPGSTKSIDISNLSTGLYIITVVDINGNRTSRKFLKD